MCKLIKMINYMFWAEQVRVDPPQGERPKCYSQLDMNPGVRRPTVKTRKFVAHKEKENHEMIN